MAGKLSIIMYSGTADKFIPLGVLAQAAAATDMQVRVFVTGFALLGFTKQHNELPFPEEFKSFAPMLMEGMKRTNTKPWFDMLSEAKTLGDVKVYACSLMASVMNIKKEDMDPIVDDIVGAASFLSDAEGGQTLFI
ncbi:MAG: DsrE/DsrF/DrsH-like family protein [Candidatus Micrarchaeia archaeon]